MMADAARLILLGVKLFKAGHGASSSLEVELGGTAEYRLLNSFNGLVIQVSKYDERHLHFMLRSNLDTLLAS